jgi:hypothetical protein
VDPLVVSVFKAAGTVGGFLLFVYVLYRLVLVGKKSGRSVGVELLGVFVTFLGAVVVPVPPREVPSETRKLKREQDGSGDPEELP